MTAIRVKNWSDFQHYKDRSPPWIKLHKSLLDNYEYQCLPIASRALAPMLWLLASESADGSIDADPKKIAFRLRITVEEVEEAVKPLIEKGFIVTDSEVLATCLQHADSETETETYKSETETEGDACASNPDASVSENAEIFKLLKSSGITDINQSNPTFIALVKAGATYEEFKGATFKAVKNNARSFAYVLKVMVNQREEAAKLKLHQGALPDPKKTVDRWWASNDGMLAKGSEFGLSPNPGESWQNFQGRIEKALAERAAA